MPTTTPPTVMIIGPHGFIGAHIAPTFLSALQTHQIAALKLGTRAQGTGAPDVRDGAEIVPVDYHDPVGLVRALRGVDVVVSCMGTTGDYARNKDVLVDACAEAGVKVYLPSEWGTDHRDLRHEHPMFTSKQAHFRKAEGLGLKTVALYTGLIMETSFCPWFGFDTSTRTWTIVGDGKVPLAMTSQRDLGPLTLRTVLLAHYTPEKCPSHVRVYSDNRSVLAYREIFERVSGEGLEVKWVALQDAEREYEGTRARIPGNMLGPLMNLLIPDGSFDHSRDCAREIINPGEQYFKWKTVDEYARDVDGLPWKDGSPW